MNEDRASRYQRQKRTASVVSLLWSLALLAGLILTGASTAIRAAAQAVTGTLPTSLQATATVAGYVVVLVALHAAGSLLLDYHGGFRLERRYGLSTQTIGGWLADEIKGTVLSAVLGVLAAALIYFFIRRFPAGWWLPAGASFAVVIVGLANLGPVLLLPLFYAVKPLEHEALRARLLRLAERAGARVLGAYEWGLAEKTRKANAALTGLGSTRRILVSDTMLADYSEDEIEVVLAHELAHHVHGDIWKGLVFESALVIAGFYLAAKVLAVSGPLAGLTGPDDVAGLPLLLLSAGAVSLVVLPLAHALSRQHERKADRFALELTNNPNAFVSAMTRLGAQSLAEENPGRLVQWLFYSHPPIRERIAAARQFAG